MPIVDTARAIDRALGVSFDYLVGDAPDLLRNSDAIAHLEAIAKLNPDDQLVAYRVIDALIRDASVKKAYAG